MTDAQISPSGLATLHERMAWHVQNAKLPGLVALVAAGGDVHVDAIGTLSFDDDTPMGRDTIFRIASLTKPVVAVATMILIEEGKLRLGDRVEPYLPELADRQVLCGLDSSLGDSVPANRAITVEDVLTYRFGFGSIMAAPGTYPIQVAEEHLQLGTLGPPWPPAPHTPDSWIAALGSLPLLAHPGEQWFYNTAGEVLGVLVERVAGQPVEQFMRERLFDPLGMQDTSFSVPPSKVDRFATAYETDGVTGELKVLDAAADGYWSRPPSFPDCAGGLVSTIDDYWAFASMMVGAGRNADVQILRPETVRAMCVDRLTSQQRESARLFFDDGNSWGYGMTVPADCAEPGVSRGIGWDGGTGTTWRSDLDKGVTGILFTQRAMTSPEPPRVFDDFWHGVDEAVKPRARP